METDLSKQLYDRYFKLRNRVVTVTMRNGREITGVLIAFYRGEKDWGEPYIAEWHIVDEKYKMTSGIDAFGFPIGEYIKQKEIESIKFLADNSEIKFINKPLR